MSFIGTQEFKTRVQLGQVPGWSYVRKFGHDDNAATGFEPIWVLSTAYSGFLSSAQSLEAVSSAANDGAGAATGALELEVQGLDANFNSQTVTVSLNGTTPAALSGTWRRVFRAKVTSAGSSEWNEGNLTIRVPGPGATVAYIDAQNSQTEQAIYSVPTGYTFLLEAAQFTVQTGNNVTFQMRTRDRIDDADPVVRVFSHLVGVDAPLDVPFYFEKFTGPCDIWAVAQGSGTPAVSCEFGGYLVQD